MTRGETDSSEQPAAGRGETSIGIDGPAQPVDPRAISVWRWSALIGAVLPLAAAGVFTVFTRLTGAPIAGLATALYPLLLLALGLHVGWYPAARFRHLRYRVDDVGLEIESGILWRKRTSLPRVRIQHTDISQGPIERRYGVATLRLYTAGSRFTLIELPGLEHSAAVALRDRLLEREAGDAV